MSFKPEVRTTNIESWAGNALRFKTREEAEKYAIDLALRWTAVYETRVIEVDDPPNYEWIEGHGAKSILPTMRKDNG
jgi:hypothetical protein